VGTSEEDSPDYDQTSDDVDQDNNNHQTVELDCAPEEIGDTRAVGAEAAKEDDVIPLEDKKTFEEQIEDENDYVDPEDESDDEELMEETAVHPSLLIETPSEVDSSLSPEASLVITDLRPRGQPLSELRAYQAQKQREQEELEQERRQDDSWLKMDEKDSCL
jgi:hypothetical protein